jgi:hypothetical protein
VQNDDASPNAHHPAAHPGGRDASRHDGAGHDGAGHNGTGHDGAGHDGAPPLGEALAAAGGPLGSALAAAAGSGAAAAQLPTRRASDGGARGGAERAIDRTLALLVQAAERGTHVGLTVATSDGVVVTGTLAGTVEYCRALADQFTTMMGGTVMDEAFAEAFRTLVDDAYGIAQGDRRANPDAAAFDHAIPFVHLIEARYVSGTTFLPHGRHGVLWRCRMADVTSWSLGDLTQS